MQQQQQLNIQLQEQIKNLQQVTAPPEKPEKIPQTRKAKVQEELVDAVAIEYKVSSHKHPNHHLDGCFDTFPIDDIEGFGIDIHPKDVSKYFELKQIKNQC